jgi:hypothetical protein
MLGSGALIRIVMGAGINKIIDNIQQMLKTSGEKKL